MKKINLIFMFIFLIVLNLSFVFSLDDSSVLLDDLKVVYHFNNVAENEFYELYDYNPTATYNLYYTDSIYGSGLLLNETGYIDLGNNLFEWDEGTVSLWIKTDGNSPKGIFDTGVLSLFQKADQLGTTSTNIITGNHLSSSGWVVAYGDNVLNSNFINIVLTWETGTNGLKLYINGTLNDERTILDLRKDLTRNTRIGGLQNLGSPYLFKGIIDELYIWNRSLNEFEVEYLSEGTSNNRFYPFKETPTILNVKNLSLQYEPTQKFNVTIDILSNCQIGFTGSELKNCVSSDNINHICSLNNFNLGLNNFDIKCYNENDLGLFIQETFLFERLEREPLQRISDTIITIFRIVFYISILLFSLWFISKNNNALIIVFSSGVGFLIIHLLFIDLNYIGIQLGFIESLVLALYLYLIINITRNRREL